MFYDTLFLYRQPWLASKSECPTCRVPALELRRLRIINNAVEKLAVRGDDNDGGGGGGGGDDDDDDEDDRDPSVTHP